MPLRKAISSGRFGRITYAAVTVPWWRTDEYYKDSWHGTWKLDGGGALMNQSVHMIDLLCNLMGPIESVQAFIEALEHGGNFEISGAEARKAVEVILAVYQSAQKQKPVKLSLS